MKSSTTLYLVTLISSFFFFSCERSGSGKCTETNISTATRSSHNAGENCAKCHTQGEEGRGCFTVCGTAYKNDRSTPMADAVLLLLTRDSSYNITGVKREIKGDKSGNFYTTESTDFVGTYPAIISKNGDTTFMGSSLTTTASCNSCHSAKNGTQSVVYGK
jgi:hypothetical protein